MCGSTAGVFGTVYYASWKHYGNRDVILSTRDTGDQSNPDIPTEIWYR